MKIYGIEARLLEGGIPWNVHDKLLPATLRINAEHLVYRWAEEYPDIEYRVVEYEMMRGEEGNWHDSEDAR